MEGDLKHMKVTIGFIGVGDIITSHLDALKANPEYELIGICRRSEEKLRRQAGELGCKGFTDYHDLLAEKPQVVLISLPHALHAGVTVEALEAGCHVLVEKPMAISVPECRDMLTAAQKCRRHLIVTESASFTPGAILTGRKFQTGNLGRFFTGSILNERFYFHPDRPAWFLDPAASGGGMFINVGLHRLAVARACLPGLEPIAVAASVCHADPFPVEACTSALVRYRDGGAMIYEEVGYFPRPEWLNTGTHFIFEEGIVMWDATTWRMMTRKGQILEEPLSPQPAPYAPIYTNMLRAIRGQDYNPTAHEYAVDTALALAAYAGARQNKEIDLTGPEWIIPAK
jgi:predicted dehydrogenase